MKRPVKPFRPPRWFTRPGCRLVGRENPKFANRAQFFAAAAEAMRRILIDNARHKRAMRHATNTLGGSPFPFRDLTPPNLPQRFYRGRQLQGTSPSL